MSRRSATCHFLSLMSRAGSQNSSHHTNTGIPRHITPTLPLPRVCGCQHGQAAAPPKQAPPSRCSPSPGSPCANSGNGSAAVCHVLLPPRRAPLLLLLLWLLPRTPNVHDAGLQEEAHLLGDLHACVAPRERAGGERQRAGESEREREREGETRERARSRERKGGRAREGGREIKGREMKGWSQTGRRAWTRVTVRTYIVRKYICIIM